MNQRRKTGDEPEVTIVPEGDDADDSRTFDHDDAEAVRRGELSAAQLPGGHGNVDPNEPDAQYPPGVVDNRSVAGDVAGEPADFVPERKRDRFTPTASNVESASGVRMAGREGNRTTAATPAFEE